MVDAPEIKLGSKIFVLFIDGEWYPVKVIKMEAIVICTVEYFDKSTSDFNILPEHFRPNHDCQILGTNSPYWADTAPAKASERDERRYNKILGKMIEIRNNEKILKNLECRAATLGFELHSSRSHDEEIDDGTERKCFGCKNILTKHTRRTIMKSLHYILKDTVNKSDLDMVNIMAGEAQVRVTTIRKNPLSILEMCKGCIVQSNDTIVFLSSQNSNWLCQWCRTIYSKGDSGSHCGNLCKVCDDILIKIERNKEHDREFLNRGMRPLISLLGIISGDGQPVRPKHNDIDAIVSLLNVHFAIEIDTNHKGSKPEVQKDQKNIDTLRTELHCEDGRHRVHIRIKPLKKYKEYTSLLRWLILRDLVVMLYRMFEKGMYLDVEDPIFYMFYEADSKLIDINRKPYIVNNAVSLPTSELLRDPRRFTDWECMVDPLLPHYSKQTLLFLKNRIPLDKLERPTGF